MKRILIAFFTALVATVTFSLNAAAQSVPAQAFHSTQLQPGQCAAVPGPLPGDINLFSAGCPATAAPAATPAPAASKTRPSETTVTVKSTGCNNPWPWLIALIAVLGFLTMGIIRTLSSAREVRHTAEAEAGQRERRLAEAAARERARQREPLEEEYMAACRTYQSTPSPQNAERLDRAQVALARFDGAFTLARARVDINVQPGYAALGPSPFLGGPAFIAPDKPASP